MLTVPCDWSESSAYRVYDSNAVIVGEVIAARQALPEDRYDAVVQVGGKSLLTGCRDNIRLLISHLFEALRTTKGINCSFFCKLDVAFMPIPLSLYLHCIAMHARICCLLKIRRAIKEPTPNIDPPATQVN